MGIDPLILARIYGERWQYDWFASRERIANCSSSRGVLRKQEQLAGGYEWTLFTGVVLLAAIAASHTYLGCRVSSALVLRSTAYSMAGLQT